MPKNSRVSSRIHGIPYEKTGFIRTTRNSNKDFVGVQCPICMEHPHNAVLLICSSYDKGCRPYICNTLCQFNCLGQYRGAMSAASGLRCPLCRGKVSEERAVEDGACRFMNRKPRGCERCEFVGDREELESHWWVRHSADELPRLLEVGYAVDIPEADRPSYDEPSVDDPDYDPPYDFDAGHDDIASDAMPADDPLEYDPSEDDPLEYDPSEDDPSEHDSSEYDPPYDFDPSLADRIASDATSAYATSVEDGDAVPSTTSAEVVTMRFDNCSKAPELEN